MAWTAPATWVDGVAVAAADFNPQIRDNLRHLKGLDGVPYIENALELPEVATPATPASGRARIYPKANGLWYGLDDAGVETQLGFGAGTAFPGSPATGQRWFRTDLGWLCYYDGTRWLTAHEYAESLDWASNIADPLPDASYVNNQSIMFNVSRSDYGVYFTRAEVWMFVTTTNNTSNYWVLELTNTGTVCGAFSTQNDAANTNLWKIASTPVVLATARQYWQMRTSNNVGTPGNLIARATVSYRLIVT